MNIRSWMLIVVLLLLAIGLIMVYSSSAIYAYEQYKDSAYFLKRQVFYIMLGCIGAIGVMCVPVDILRKYSRVALCISLFLLCSVFVPGLGSHASGAQRWLKIGPLRFQPSEFMKLTMIFYFADVLALRCHRIRTFAKGFLPLCIVLGPVLGLILLQPDLGTTFAIGVVSLIMFFVGGVNPYYLGAMLLAAVPVLYLLILGKPYRRRRILAFLDPWADPKGIGFQIIQSFVALGCGGLWGVGLGHSRQKLFYLPHSHTDFIFSIIGEELGLIGAACVVLLFMALIVLGFAIAFQAKDRFGRLLATGLTSLIGLEVFINIAVCAGLIPTKGLPLPFISFGGSALIVHMIAIGLLFNISKNRFYTNRIEVH